MAVVGFRVNTFKVDFKTFKTRPSFTDIHAFINGVLGLRNDQLKRLQMHHIHNCAYVKCVDRQTAEMIVEQHDMKHSIEVDGVQYKVRLSMDDECTEVKVYDLSENITNDDIAECLKQYGKVHSVQEQVWGPTFACEGIPSGVRVVKMTLQRHIKSVITVQGEQTLITYKNQPKSCRHCLQPLHAGRTCSDNRKASKSIPETSSRNDKKTTAEAIASTASTTQSSTERNVQHREKRNARQLSPSETKPPPPKRTNATTEYESDENETETMSSVDLSDSEPEPAPDDIDKWIVRFNKHSGKVDKFIKKKCR